MSDPEDRASYHESDDEDEDSEEEDSYTTMTQDAMSNVKAVFDGSASKGDVDQFLKNHSQVLREPSQDGTTFLHTIVQLVHERTNEKPVSASNVKPLYERLVKEYPYQLRMKNEEGQTPLYRAIHLKRYNTWKLVDYTLDSCSDAQCIEDALRMPCGKGESSKTCLTLAFEKDLRAKVLRNLVNHASEEALELKDGSGRTPFHWAVQYAQCTDEKVDVIKLLLKKDGEVVDKKREADSFRPVETFLDCKYMERENGVEYSVYGEHERTKRVYLASENARKERETKADQERADGKAPNPNIPVRERDPPKTGREKDPKSYNAGEFDRGSRKADRDRDRERRRQDLEKLDENERRRLELKEKELREKELKEKEQRRQPRDRSRTRQFRDQKERLDDGTMGTPRSPVTQIGTDHAPNMALKRAVTQRFNVDEERKKRNRKAGSSSSASKKPDSKLLARNSAKILRMLKLHYMRTRSIKMVTSFLYGKNIHQDVQICFDYEGLPPSIDDYVFMERFGKDCNSGIRFDEVLMYVKFPNVSVKRSGRRAPKPRARGRQDMEFFFDWLYNKGVRRILKVQVADSGECPHSDESIQLSLEKIMVEHLDWQKVDLDPRTICQISSKAEKLSPSDADPDNKVIGARNKLREVTLKWSGSNAVLRAWSEPDGLPQLQKLEVINLSAPAHSELHDTKSWVQSNIEEFRARLNKNANENRKVEKNIDVIDLQESGAVKTLSKPKTEIKIDKPPQERKIKVEVKEGKKGTEDAVSSSGVQKTSGNSNRYNEHAWLTCMERFAGCMDIFWKSTVDLSHNALGQAQNGGSHPLQAGIQNLEKDVVVALIDDGVDCCDTAFSGRAIEGKSFDYQDGGVGQYYISARGHGTEMARMILKVCPMASIYSIRLKTHISPDKGHATIDAVSAALAIEAALEKNATIISMSWTLPVPPDGSKERRLLDSVLERACVNKVLMFCSSSDQINATKHYPSAFKRERFFLIGAAHDDGSAFGHAGKDNDFIFPGVKVVTSGGSSLPVILADKTSSTKESTGSSIATALAAGLAAMVTYCFKASALGIIATRTQQGKDYYVAGPELVKPGDVDKIAEHDVLNTAFKRLGKMDSGRFIEVWDRFNTASEALEAESKYDDKLTYIMNLCSNLIER